jgi:hypothetical protein
MRAAVTMPIKTPSPHEWRTTDEDEIARRRLRARTEQMRILDPSVLRTLFRFNRKFYDGRSRQTFRLTEP